MANMTRSQIDAELAATLAPINRLQKSIKYKALSAAVIWRWNPRPLSAVVDFGTMPQPSSYEFSEDAQACLKIMESEENARRLLVQVRALSAEQCINTDKLAAVMENHLTEIYKTIMQNEEIAMYIFAHMKVKINRHP